MARELLSNGQFEETEEDMPIVLEEFSPLAQTEEATPSGTSSAPRTRTRRTALTDKLGTTNTAESVLSQAGN